VTDPPVSLALALSAIVAGAVKVAPDDGEVSDTEGGWFDDEDVPFTVRALDVVVAPALSVATAVNEEEPAATFHDTL
jgi:hypothetical protein